VGRVIRVIRVIDPRASLRTLSPALVSDRPAPFAPALVARSAPRWVGVLCRCGCVAEGVGGRVRGAFRFVCGDCGSGRHERLYSGSNNGGLCARVALFGLLGLFGLFGLPY
jgi:hypothetical protein